MSIKFKSQVAFDLDDQNKLTRSTRTKSNHDLDFRSFQSVVMRKQPKQKDTYVPNKIAKNDFFGQQDAIFGESNHLQNTQSQVMIDQVKTQTMQNKSQAAKRKKGSTSIKLQPLRTLQLKKNVQKIEFIQAPPPPTQMLKRQSEPVPPTQNSFHQQQHQISKALSSVYRSNLLNFEMNSSSSDEEPQKKEMNLDLKDISLKKPEFKSSSTFFFEEEEDKAQKKEQEKKPELRQLKFKRTLKKKSQTKNQTKQTTLTEQVKKPQTIIFNQEQRQQKQNSQNQQNQAKVGIQAEPNPQKGNQQSQNSNQNQPQQQNVQLSTVQHEKQINFQTMKRLILSQIQKQSVLNLRLVRSKSIFNLFSPQFRLEFVQDSYYIMGCKKTSSKPTSTFVFTCSQFNFEETSKKYMGKMKSNIAGNVYNIFGPGMSPSNAKNYNLQPRQLLATVVYKTELFGTGKPKQFSVFIKKPDFMYYRDLSGVRMYDEEIPLHELYCNYHENMDKIQVIHTRKPSYFKDTKEYVMNFEGKVKKSSIKNFILEERDNQNSKALMFGKVNDDQYVLDILNPLSPIIGIGIALTVFDSRIGSD